MGALLICGFCLFRISFCCRQVRELKARDEKLKSAESSNNFQQEVHLQRELTRNGSHVGVGGEVGGKGKREVRRGRVS